MRLLWGFLLQELRNVLTLYSPVPSILILYSFSYSSPSFGQKQTTGQIIPARWFSFFLVSVFLDNQVAARPALTVGDVLQQLVQPAAQRFTDTVQLIQ